MRLRRFPLLALLAASALTACGGGGGGDTSGGGTPPSDYVKVGGQLSGLGAGKVVTIGDASGPKASFSANGFYSVLVPKGSAYALRVLTQPERQTCAFTSSAQGTANADVTDIAVACQDDAVDPNARHVGGSLTGLDQGKTVVLQLQAGAASYETQVGSDGRFLFTVPISGPYTVSVRSQPTGQICTVIDGQGSVVPGGQPADVRVSCGASAFKIGGTVTGSAGSIVVQNSSTREVVRVVGNGSFVFPQPIVANSSYAITVPAAVTDGTGTMSCTVVNGTGTAVSDVHVAITCTATGPVTPPVQPVVIPAIPSGLTMGYDVKAFKLSWAAVTAPAGGGAVTYNVFEDADGPGPAAGTQVGTGITATNYTQLVNGLLHTRLNANYSVQACNTAGCSPQATPVAVNVNQAIGYFKASNTVNSGGFGNAVALSGDGRTLAVGAYAEDSNATGIGGDQANSNAFNSGAVYVFTHVGGVWSQQAYVKASNTEGTDMFGYSVALSGDGSTLAVSADGESSNATGINGNQADNSAVSAGAVYVFTRSAGVWSQQAYVKASNTDADDHFGLAVALSGDGNTLAVGAFGEDSNATGINGNQADNSAAGAGAVYVFTRSAGVWSQQAYVKASNAAGGDDFGLSVALSFDGSTLAVGAFGEDSNATGINGNQADNSAAGAGAVYVFTRSAGVWSQQAYVKASNADGGDRFGYRVGLSVDGSTLAVVAIGERSNATGINGNQADNSIVNAGAAYVFARSGGVWSQQAYIKASNTGNGGEYGNSMALSADGSTLAVGSGLERSNALGINGDQTNSSAPLSGAVYVYTRSGSTWTQQAYVKASNTDANDLFGYSVALSADGGLLAVGATLESSSATGINGDQTDNGVTRGAVYIY